MMLVRSWSVFVFVLCVLLLLVPLSLCDDSVSDSASSVSSLSAATSASQTETTTSPISSSEADSDSDAESRSEPSSESESESESSSSLNSDDTSGPTELSSHSEQHKQTTATQGNEDKDTDEDKDKDKDKDTNTDTTDNGKQADTNSESQSQSQSQSASASASPSQGLAPVGRDLNLNSTTSAPTPTSPPQVEGAIFAGFQGQAFHFRAMADEVFNLVSSPHLQVNAHMTYIASGDCSSNETACFSHPGAYMDQLGFLVGPYKLQVTAGSRNAGLSLHVQGARIKPGQFPQGLRVPTTTRTPNNDTNNQQLLIIRHDTHTQVTITTTQLQFVVANSDGFLNIAVSLLDANLLQLGSRRFNLSDPDYCHNNFTTSIDEPTQQQQARIQIEKQMQQLYGTNTLHGLIGQTWRAATVCDRAWIGTVQDYMCSGLFASDYVYCLYQPSNHSS